MVDILYEHFETGLTTAQTSNTNQWPGQGFTPSVSHTVTKIGLSLAQTGTIGTFTISIRAADGSGLPTGPDLGSVSFSEAELPVGLAFFEKYLDTPVDVVAGTTYCIVWRCTSFFIWGRNVSGGYAGGVAALSTDAGSSWGSVAPADYGFREYATSAPPTVTSTRATGSLRSITAVGNITNKGGYSVIKRGVAYNTSGSDPDPSVDPHIEESGDFATGEFTEFLSGLLEGTTYYVRPYAYSAEEGYGYGTTLTATTNSGVNIIATTNGRFVGKAADVSYATMRAGGGGVAVIDPTGTSPINLAGVDDTMTASPWLFRTFLYFDLKTIPDRIYGINLVVWVYDIGAGMEEIIIEEGVQDFELPTVANFVSQNSISTKLGGKTNLSGIPTGQYVKIPLNSDGVDFVKTKAGDYCKFCLMTKADFDNSYDVTIHDGKLHFYLSQESGKEPYLEFTLDPSFNNLSDLMVKNNFI